MAHSTQARNTGWFGRILRFATGLGLLTMAYFSVRNGGTGWILPTAGWLVGILAFYTIIHTLIRRFVPNLNRWLGAIIAVSPVATLFFSGIGVATLAAVIYVGVSLLVDSFNGDAGCEVMAFPGLFAGQRTHLPCIAFSPVDWAEWRLTDRWAGTKPSALGGSIK